MQKDVDRSYREDKISNGQNRRKKEISDLFQDWDKKEEEVKSEKKW